MASKEELFAELDALVGLTPTRPKPKVAVSEGRPVRDVDIPVHPTDPNAKNAVDGVVSVRRVDRWQSAYDREAAEAAGEREAWRKLKPGQVRINLAEAQRQWEIDQQMKAWDREQRRRNDPCRLGLYGPIDEENY